MNLREGGLTTSESDTGVSRSALWLMSACATQARRRVILSSRPDKGESPDLAAFLCFISDFQTFVLLVMVIS